MALPRLAVFPTALGWFGLLGEGRTVWRLTIGHGSAEKVRHAVRREKSIRWPDCFVVLEPGSMNPVPASQRPALRRPDHEATNAEIVESDWFPELRLRLQRYAEGSEFDFRDCDVLFGRLTPFQRRVFAATRSIGYGQTITYGQLAARAGREGAARAVGNVMAANPVPIIVPCHRVVAAGGKWGGYSAPQGVTLKRRLLELEESAPCS